MTAMKAKDYTGYSELSISDAMIDALEQIDQDERIKVIETRSSQQDDNQCRYQVTIAIQDE